MNNTFYRNLFEYIIKLNNYSVGIQSCKKYKSDNPHFKIYQLFFM